MRSLLALLVLVTLLAAPGAQAQVIDGFGVRAGGNTSSIDAFFPGYTSLRGFHVGVFVELAITNELSFMPEIEYGRRGYGIRGEGIDQPTFTPFEASTRLDFISLPILFRLHTPFADQMSIFAVAGPRLDFLVGRDAGTWDVGQGPREDELAEALDSFGAGGSFGFGGALHGLVGREFRLEGRLNYGVTDWLSFDDTENVYMRSIDVSVVVMF
jgi:hypothetical protein